MPAISLHVLKDSRLGNCTSLEVYRRHYISESVAKNYTSKIQEVVDELCSKTRADKFRLNEIKCKEARVRKWSKALVQTTASTLNGTAIQLGSLRKQHLGCIFRGNSNAPN